LFLLLAAHGFRPRQLLMPLDGKSSGTENQKNG
jgi:hypothetical protein